MTLILIVGGNSQIGGETHSGRLIIRTGSKSPHSHQISNEAKNIMKCYHDNTILIKNNTKVKCLDCDDVWSVENCTHDSWYVKNHDDPKASSDICKCSYCGTEWSFAEAWEEQRKKQELEKRRRQSNCRHDRWHVACGSYENRSPYSLCECDDCGYTWSQELPYC